MAGLVSLLLLLGAFCALMLTMHDVLCDFGTYGVTKREAWMALATISGASAALSWLLVSIFHH